MSVLPFYRGVYSSSQLHGLDDQNVTQTCDGKWIVWLASDSKTFHMNGQLQKVSTARM